MTALDGRERIRQFADQFRELGCALLSDAAPDDTFLLDRPFASRTPGLMLAGPVAPVSTYDDMLPCLQVLESAPPGHVLYLHNEKSGRSEALAGDIFVTAMRSHDLPGLVVDGAVRDLRDTQPIGIPVFSTQVTFLSARTAELATTEVPCVLEVPTRRPGGSDDDPSTVTMRPGDWLFADDDGVMLVRAERVSAVIAAARLLTEREDALRAALDAGGRMGDLCGLNAYLRGDGELRFAF
ncbi:MAG: RraA family protein [Patulibacter sp.]